MLDFSTQGFDTAFELLRSKRLSEATKPFMARGNKMKRCPRCQLRHCICPFRNSLTVDFDVVLLMHRNEILKPTNTGRLIADCFPNNTYAFIWERTVLDCQLKELLAMATRHWLLLFPGEKNPSYQPSLDNKGTAETLDASTPKKTTFLIIDGTWKQARKVYSQSPWLQTMPALTLNPSTSSEYNMRKAPSEFQTSTAEAFISTLRFNGHHNESQLLGNYFQIFNHHYHASRLNVSPEQLTESNSSKVTS